MSFFSDVSMALQIWEKDGTLIKKGIAIFQKLEAVDNGQLGEKIDAVLKSEGIDVSAILAGATIGAMAAPSRPAPASQALHPASDSMYEHDVT